jgi:hypothetical protein
VYSISGTTLTFTTAPQNGYTVEVMAFGTITVGNQTVTSINGQTGAVTLETGTDWQSTIQTSNFTAVAGKGYFVNTTSAAITVTLPSSPSAGDELTIVDYAGTADTNTITITSSDNINGAADDVKINYERGGVSIVYVDATQGWIAYNAANETATALLPDIPLTVDHLVVAGGAGATSDISGGGGAGGLRTSYGSSSGGGASAESGLALDAGTNYTVTVGGGGTGLVSSGGSALNGSNSVFSTITSIGGGGGHRTGSGATGGSGGGFGRGNGTSYTPGSGTANQGYAGGPDTGAVAGTGGGGAAAVGGNSSGGGNPSQGGAGGAGLAVSITGSSVTYAGGGGGGGYYGTGGAGGVGGGGTGGTGAANNNATNGTANTGGGAGGGEQNSTVARSGGSGIVILRYPNSYTITIGAGLTGTTATDGSDKVTSFTAGTGNIQFN